MSKKKVIIFLIIFVCGFSIYYYFTYEKDYTLNSENFNNLVLNGSTIDNEGNNDILDGQNDNKENKIKIYITGEVNKSGVYELPENSRISDAISAAEGITENANVKYINLAFKLEDGMQIYIPNKNENLNNISNDKTYNYVTSGSQVNSGEDANANLVSGENTGNNGNSKKSKSGVNFNNASVNSIGTQSKKININSATQEELEELPGIGASTALKICNYRKENGKFKTKEELKKVKGIGDAKFNKIKDLITV